jgi:CRISPR-associated protein Cmr1
MKSQSFKIDLITPCFCGGAQPMAQAEIRAPSIRGQLRWWFRTLGGFRSLAARRLALRDQEALIFGSIHGESGTASPLIVRVSGLAPSTDIVDDIAMGAQPGSDRGYLLFPLRTEKPKDGPERRRDRGVFNKAMAAGAASPSFTLTLIWLGPVELWKDIQALVAIFANLGALGFRSRRAMGSLAPASQMMHLNEAFSCFNAPKNVELRSLPAKSAPDAITVLARWLRSWRSHGRTGNNAVEQSSPGFQWAQRDHDLAARKQTGTAFRPALGLPIITKYGTWNESYDQRKAQRNPAYKGDGRFASPVILRPHRAANSQWQALVIFVNFHQWDLNKAAFLNGKGQAVSLDLYTAMKADRNLSAFQ